jgi:hypothetical protein
MRVLKIISDIEIVVTLPEDAEIVTVSMGDYLTQEYQEKFDMIFCVHSLQTLWASQVASAIKKMVGDLANLGELYIHVPATEHAAKALLRDETDPAAFYLIWGTEKRPFHVGFTLFWLRALVEQAGAIVRNANVGVFKLEFNGQEVKAPEHEILATVVRD